METLDFSNPKPVFRPPPEGHFPGISWLLATALVVIKHNTPRTLGLLSPQIRAYMRQVLEGIGYLHENHVLHLDVKVRCRWRVEAGSTCGSQALGCPPLGPQFPCLALCPAARELAGVGWC